MDKQTFSSIQATTNTSRYAAAVFHKGLTLFWLHNTNLSFFVFFPFLNHDSLLLSTHQCASRVRVSRSYLTFQFVFTSVCHDSL